MFDDRAERKRGHEIKRTDYQDHCDQPEYEQWRMSRQSPFAWRNFFLANQRACKRQCRNRKPITANKHRNGAGDIRERRIGVHSGESAPIVIGLRSICVQNLAKAVRTRIVHDSYSRGNYNCQSSEYQNH